ncbi:MAG: hypothetical protein AAFO06_04560 [Cyanobacteria bacterium J06597_16]
MALTDEWQEWHLTPDGWVEGSYKTDFSETVTVDTPDNVVFSLRCGDYQRTHYDSNPFYREVMYGSENYSEVKALIKRYGDKAAGYHSVSQTR